MFEFRGNINVYEYKFRKPDPVPNLFEKDHIKTPGSATLHIAHAGHTRKKCLESFKKKKKNSVNVNYPNKL